MLLLAGLATASTAAEAGGPLPTSWEIPYPPGARLDVNVRAQLKAQQISKTEIRVTAPPEAAFAKAKARWVYAGRTCYADGGLAQVMTDIDRCAERALSAK